MIKKFIRPGFTLIEMLIVIVIIGILAAALIPRLTGIQARARDTARSADMRNVSSALEVYALDNGGTYPSGNFVVLHHSPSPLRLSNFFIPQAIAQEATSSLETISAQLGSYLTSLPTDPNGNGIATTSLGACVSKGKSYGYYSAPGLYAITSIKESQKGNASACGDTIDRDKSGNFEKLWKGLNNTIVDEPTDESCFIFSAGTIVKYDVTCPKDVVIPNVINGDSVTSLGSEAFKDANITSVIIPSSVTSIGSSAFSYNSLASVIIPSSVTSMGNNIFRNNNLTSVTIPSSVTSLGAFMFRNNRLTSITIPSSITSIGQQVFFNNYLTSITIPSSVTSIGGEAFYNNRLTSVTIPSSVTSMGGGAFNKNGLWNSVDITNFIPWSVQTRNIVGTAWVKQ